MSDKKIKLDVPKLILISISLDYFVHTAVFKYPIIEDLIKHCDFTSPTNPTAEQCEKMRDAIIELHGDFLEFMEDVKKDILDYGLGNLMEEIERLIEEEAKNTVLH